MSRRSRPRGDGSAGPTWSGYEFAELRHVGADFLDLLCTVSSMCALRPEWIRPRMRLDGGTSRRAAS